MRAPQGGTRTDPLRLDRRAPALVACERSEPAPPPAAPPPAPPAIDRAAPNGFGDRRF